MSARYEASTLPARSVLRWLEVFFWAAGSLLLGWVIYSWADARLYQASQERALARMVAAARSSAAAPASLPGEAGGSRPVADSRVGVAASSGADPLLIGKISIERLSVDAVIREGVDDKTLRRAVGHVPGTARFEEVGNVALAGHRDTFFRGLRDVKRGDLIRVRTPLAAYEYRVKSTEVVKPEETRVLESEGTPALTLVTCWPFEYVGNAPRRFIVHAERTSGIPEFF